MAVNDESFFQEGPKMLVAHTEQDDIDNGVYDGTDMFFIGGGIFDSRWNTLDGAGRPETDGNGQPRPRRDAPQNFNRISGPDGDSCNSCHNFQNGTGGGDAVHNTFVGTGSYPFVNFDGAEGDLFQDLHLDGVGNVRSTTAIFGSGFLELLAREMTFELFALRDQALAQAQGGGSEVTVDLEAKGVSYGTLTARPDGSLDTSAVVGVDPDLVIKPFRQKGTVVSLRAFTTAAMNEHHGIQAAELFGEGSDPDADGVVDELTVGDMTMLSVYQTLVPVPGRLLPADPGQMAAVDRGEDLFGTLGCGVCHVPSLVLDDPVFTEPGPFNPPEILGPADVPQPFAVDLTAFGPLPRLPRESDGTVIVPAFTDLKRHDMGPALADNVVEQGVGTQWFLTKRLWGFANEPPYLHDGRALTVSEAILWHGGEAQASRDAFEALPAFDQACVVDFLWTLRAMPGQPLVVVQ